MTEVNVTLIPESENADAQHADVQLTLTRNEAEQLRITLPWMLQALADRPTATERVRERRLKSHAILARLQTVLSSQLQQGEEDRESPQ